jgi:hypothetical protein
MNEKPDNNLESLCSASHQILELLDDDDDDDDDYYYYYYYYYVT